jgi:hypothetical protein
MSDTPPRVGREATQHWQAARRGELLLPFDPAGRPVWPPGAGKLEWRTCEGDGTIASFSVVRRPVQPEWSDRAPYVVAMIDLPSGHRLLSNVVDCDPRQVAIGMRVRCGFIETSDPALGLPVFRLHP